MHFEVGDLVKHNPTGIEYVVLDVDADGMTVKRDRRTSMSNPPHHVGRSAWEFWTIIAGQPGAPRPRKTHRNLDLG